MGRSTAAVGDSSSAGECWAWARCARGSTIPVRSDLYEPLDPEGEDPARAPLGSVMAPYLEADDAGGAPISGLDKSAIPT
jgi:hypothetical protein